MAPRFKCAARDLAHQAAAVTAVDQLMSAAPKLRAEQTTGA